MALPLCAFLLLLFVVGAASSPPLIHGYIVPHSHDDVGWLLTPENYYELMVQHIYNTVVEALSANASRRFISVEMAYFERWWSEATLEQQAQAKYLVATGQLEFIVGGWTMEDEACTTYSENINQMTEGHQFISENFGLSPRYGWQIDPFGASGVVHGQFAQMGFMGTVISRIDWLLKSSWQQSKSLEFHWEPSPTQGSGLSIFTHCLDIYRYTTAVDGLNWSELDLPVNPLTIDLLSDHIIANIQQRAAWYRSNIVLFPWGSDFLHFIAGWDFYNMDKLVARINEKTNSTGVEVRYATLGEYFSDLATVPGLTYPTFTGADFFPYADRTYSYWSGYFSSRSALKWWARVGEAFQQNAETLNAIAVARGLRVPTLQMKETLQVGRRANGVLTHHDAVSGTAEWYVVLDYCNTAAEGMTAVAPLAETAAASLLGGPAGLALSVNDSILASLSPSNPVLVVVHNSLGWASKRFVRASIYTGSVTVTELASGAAVPSQIVKRKKSTPTPCLYYDSCGFLGNAPADLFFLADLPPLGYSSYLISVTAEAAPSMSSASSSYSVPTGQPGTFSIGNTNIALTFSNSTGSLLSMSNLQSNKTTLMTSNFYRYVPANLEQGHNITEGAYIFHPSGPAGVIASVPMSFEVVTGPYVSEVRQYYTAPCAASDEQTETCGLTQVFRLYTSPGGDSDLEGAVELLHDIGPLRLGEDIVLRVSTPLQTNQTFWSDDNCFQSVQRRVNPAQSDPISGNFFPVTCSAFMRDDQVQVTLLTDRTHSGSSLLSGQMEIMLHRRIPTNDDEGPMALNDTDRYENVQTLLVYGDIASSVRARHRLQYLQQSPPALLFAHAPASRAGLRPLYSAMTQPLPPNVHLLSFQTPTNATTILLRLVHVYEGAEDPVYSAPVTLDVASYLAGNLTSLAERTLNSVLPIGGRSSTNFTITLKPTDVLTFWADLALL